MKHENNTKDKTLKVKLTFLVIIVLLVVSVFVSSCNRDLENRTNTNSNNKDVLKLSNKKCLLIIAPKNFRDEELFVTKRILEGNGVKVNVTSVKTGVIRGMLGGSIKVNRTIETFNPNEFDCIVVIGGLGAINLLDYQNVIDFIRKSFEENKIIGGICLGPTILAKAGILEYQEATVFPCKESLNIFKDYGVQYKNADVVISNKIITCSSPRYVEKFAKSIIKLLSES